MSARFQEMCEGDLAEVLRLWQQTAGVGLNESDTREQLAHYLRRNPGLSFVARASGKVVGAVLCGHDGRRGYLHHLAVAEAHRRKGLGTKLVGMCFSLLAELRIQKCNIFLYTNNADGKEFWKHNGWTNREELCVMQKPVIPTMTGKRHTRQIRQIK